MARAACAVSVAALAAFVAPGVARAEEARYSLGSVQHEQVLRVTAGGSVSTALGFYNIDGNVPTVLEVGVVEVPDGWTVTLAYGPAMPDGQDTVSLLIEPSSPYAVSVPCPGSRQEAIRLVSRGYVCAESVGVQIAAPRTAREGSTGTVRLAALATWDVAGVSSPPLPQEREFVFDVIVEPAEPGSAASLPLSRGTALVLGAGVACLAIVTVLRRLAKSGRVA